MIINLFDVGDWIAEEFAGVEIGVVEIEGGNLVIIVGSIIENAFF